MTTLINKSNHPVNIKRINIRVWTLRDEIEACIQKRIEEQGAENVDIEDIKAFYSSLTPRNKPYDELDQEDFEGTNEQPGIQEASDADLPEEPQDEAAADDSSEVGEQAKEMANEVMSDPDASASAQPPGFKRVKPAKEKMIPGFAFLSEVHMDQILFFGKRPYTNGQSIVIEFLIPKRFTMSAEVSTSIHIDRGSRIISDTKPSHRIQSCFTFLFDGERGELREFLKSVEPAVPPPPKKLKKQDADEGDEDDFDDLGF